MYGARLGRGENSRVDVVVVAQVVSPEEIAGGRLSTLSALMKCQGGQEELGGDNTYARAKVLTHLAQL